MNKHAAQRCKPCRGAIYIVLLCALFHPFSCRAADLTLSLPDDKSIDFQKVCIGEDNGLFAGKRFTMGDPSGGFREYPTAVTVGGSFPADTGGKRDWCFYMGTTEVTWGQYRAVTREKPSGKDLSQKDTYPAHDLSWFAVLNYIDQLNQWLYANKADELPTYDQGLGFLRLPTEEEWEFAARGGIEVSRDAFDKRTPYPAGKLAEYEWFSGPKSSHNTIKKAGVLAANPLGLHDMLGNVAEMTMALYRVEYYQGRAGGFAARGGHYLTSEKQIRSSLRTEQAFYSFDQKGTAQPNHQKTLGFRLVISAILYPSRTIAQSMDDEWEMYRQSKGKNLPAAVSVAPINQQVSVAFDDAAEHIERLKSLMQQGTGQEQELLRELAYIEASMEKTEKIRAKAAEDSAYAWLIIAGERGLSMKRQARRNLTTYEKLLTIAQQNANTAKAEQYRQRITEVKANIESMMDGYSTAIRQLGTLDRDAIDKALQKYARDLTARNAAEQVNMIPTLNDHIHSFQTHQRIDRDRWQEILIQESQ